MFDSVDHDHCIYSRHFRNNFFSSKVTSFRIVFVHISLNDMRSYRKTLIILNFIIVPARVQNLECSGNPDDMSLSISWGEPVAQGTVVVEYSVKCWRVDQSPSRELVTVPLTPAYDEGVDETLAQVTQGLGIRSIICMA
jgi:hypothetical protein